MSVPAGRWECPWHDCTICSAPASSSCDFCPRSFCQDHEEGALTTSSLEGRLCCSGHDPASPLGSSSCSTQPHCSTSSPVRVKEEPETETDPTAAEWLLSTAQYLIPCKVRYCWLPGHLWSEAACFERESSALWSVLWPPHKEETHWQTPQCRLRHGQCVDRQSVPAPSALFLVFLFFCHETLPIRPCTAQLCPLGGTTPSLYFLLSLFKVGEIVSVVSHLGIPALWWNEVRLRKQRQREGEARSKLSISSTTEPLHLLFTCCKMSLAQRRSPSPLPCSQSSLPTQSVILSLRFFLEKGTGQNDWICAIFVCPGTTLHSDVPAYVFNILMGIDEYNYIQYLCLLMFTDGFSHFTSVSGVLCLFRC